MLRLRTEVSACKTARVRCIQLLYESNKFQNITDIVIGRYRLLCPSDSASAVGVVEPAVIHDAIG
jgi:hypothetical protein